MQRAEMEELRHREANNTALQAIGPRKKLKLDPEAATTTVRVNCFLNKFKLQCYFFRRRRVVVLEHQQGQRRPHRLGHASNASTCAI